MILRFVLGGRIRALNLLDLRVGSAPVVRCRFVTGGGVEGSLDGSTGVILAAEALRFTGMVILYNGICAYAKGV